MSKTGVAPLLVSIKGSESHKSEAPHCAQLYSVSSPLSSEVPASGSYFGHELSKQYSSPAQAWRAYWSHPPM